MSKGCATVYPRVHVGLIDLGDVTGRRYGGAGFAIDGFPTTAVATIGRGIGVRARSTFQEKDLVDLEVVSRRISARLGREFEVLVEGGAPLHVGLGCKTSTVLAIVMACNALAGSKLNRRELVEVAGRGGTSGVGVNTAFVGGFVVDAGRAATPGHPFLPSSASANDGSPPPAVVTIPLPESWHIHLFLPDGYRTTGEDEVAFFEKNTPIPGGEVLEVLANVYHGVVPAVATGDIALCRNAIRAIREMGFKKREVVNQSPDVRGLLASLDHMPGVAVGMSSMGPLVYCIADGGSSDLRKRFTSEYGDAYKGVYRGRNSGAIVTVE